MDVLPILSTLRRHKLAACLIILEVALTCTIICNALHVIAERARLLGSASGLAESELLVIELGSVEHTDPELGVEVTKRDFAALRALPGVSSVVAVNQVPFGGRQWTSRMNRDGREESQQFGATMYTASEGMLDTFGLQLSEGRDFAPDELHWDNESVERHAGLIINRPLAQALFPGSSALGRTIYTGDSPAPVIGIVDALRPTQTSGTQAKEPYVVIAPQRPSFASGALYVLRVKATERAATEQRARATLEQIQPQHVIESLSWLDDMRRDFYRRERVMIGLMSLVIALLLVVTAFGIVGLASFWVQQRSRMIGTRRALGATRGQILRYFQAENFLLTGLGIGLGMLGAYGLSLALVQHWELPPLPFGYLPAGALVLWGLGQLAVLGPARRAAALPPMAALRI